MRPAAVAIEGASLALGAFSLRNLGLSLEAGQRLVILGPNGAGKSVTLEMIAGFHRPATGRITIHGRDVTDLPPERRRVSLMFQNFGLFPHLTVAENVAFGARAHGAVPGRPGAAAPAPDVETLLSRFGIAPLRARKPHDLSPGEKQRVALARALATRPDLFLFDEPFSALDARTSDLLRDELGAFLRGAERPAIFVTHDPTDAFVLADRVAVMNAGEILQSGTVEEVFRRPASPFVADFTGVENILEGRLFGRSGPTSRVAIADTLIEVRSDSLPPRSDDGVILCIRAEDVSLRLVAGTASSDPAGSPPVNRLPGRVAALTNLGVLVRVTLDCGFRLVACLTSRNARELGLAPGCDVVADIGASSIHLLAAERLPDCGPGTPGAPV